jgi:hypothetical protein
VWLGVGLLDTAGRRQPVTRADRRVLRDRVLLPLEAR